MAGSTVKIDDTTRNRLKALAAAAGMSMKDYLARVAEEKEHEQQLDTATAAFRRVIGTPRHPGPVTEVFRAGSVG